MGEQRCRAYRGQAVVDRDDDERIAHPDETGGGEGWRAEQADGVGGGIGVGVGWGTAGQR